VAAGPANVGENCPRLDVVTALAWRLVALPVAAAAPPKAPSSTTGSDSRTARLRMVLVRMPNLLSTGGSPGAAQFFL
jgi:hypothetical protein